MLLRLVLLVSLAQSQDFLTSLKRNGINKTTIKQDSTYVQRGEAYTLEIELGPKTEFIEFQIEEYYATCQWLYKPRLSTDFYAITDELDACDYPVRSITTS